ncbi:hypothetical protein [Tautonia plasticadhaerens]|uniref:Carboxypeptidase regulatory-like domain-containing protein n=1 Tax=Tautonia plasticadhaerens TaxID=2527974 RepID=A0A518HE77_9BACT|nr:hypothetical protein [Tautonia plasticadhaerens]QDV39143.1 hypothetical protein ElP_71070 [Tautonia plasticadhaerens]
MTDAHDRRRTEEVRPVLGPHPHIGRLLAPVALAALGLAGCSSGDRVATYPVAGRVVVGGEPAAGAFVVFHPVAAPVAEGAGNPSAQVRRDGSFALTTFDEADGAPAGDYAVTVQWRKLIRNGADALPGPDIVPPDYARPETTPLKAIVVEGENPSAEFRIEAARRR